MAIEALDHYTIQCESLAATRDFYCDVLGLEDGPRPDLGFAGHWLYCGGKPIVHLMPLRGGTGRDDGTGVFDHIAFRGGDPQAMIAQLRARNIEFRENWISDVGLHQIFLRDPNGVQVEMNFRV